MATTVKVTNTQKTITKRVTKRIVLGLVILAALFWMWPNLVHEPLHRFALTVQGSSGFITFDWGFPAQPSTTRTAPVDGVVGGLFFLLLPSLFSLFLLVVLWMTRRRAGFITHVVLPTYLTFDLTLNILHRYSASSDFRFLTALPGWIGVASVAIVFAMGTVVILAGVVGMNNNKMNKMNNKMRGVSI